MHSQRTTGSVLARPIASSSPSGNAAAIPTTVSVTLSINPPHTSVGTALSNQSPNNTAATQAIGSHPRCCAECSDIAGKRVAAYPAAKTASAPSVSSATSPPWMNTKTGTIASANAAATCHGILLYAPTLMPASPLIT